MLKQQKSNRKLHVDAEGTADATSRLILPLQQHGNKPSDISLKREKSVVNPLNRMGGISSPKDSPTKAKRETFNDHEAVTNPYKSDHIRTPILAHNEEFQVPASYTTFTDLNFQPIFFNVTLNCANGTCLISVRRKGGLDAFLRRL